MNNIEKLYRAGIVSADSEVIHNRRNTILKSNKDHIVYRVSEGKIQDDTPQDVAYSHDLSWQIAQSSNAVLSPLNAKPIIYDEFIVSQYSLADPEIDKCSTQEFVKLLGRAANIAVGHLAKLRKLNVYDYVRDRLELSTSNDAAHLRKWLQYYYQAHSEEYAATISDCATGFVHGDLHSNNIVKHEGMLKLIDLDSASSGPPSYDLATWHLRYLSGDDRLVDVQAMVDTVKNEEEWNDSLYQAMIGWKTLSSMSYLLLNYENYPDFKYRVTNIKNVLSTYARRYHHQEIVFNE